MSAIQFPLLCLFDSAEKAVTARSPHSFLALRQSDKVPSRSAKWISVHSDDNAVVHGRDAKVLRDVTSAGISQACNRARTQTTFLASTINGADASSRRADAGLGEADAGQVEPMPARKEPMPARGELRVNFEV
ncbi:hypothetical protein Q1695_006012 [Nippostrongylus brasiliensis]|nr:hypothetical protein Q1695_006012 [Nippostrongylus brasiliensis]